MQDENIKVLIIDDDEMVLEVTTAGLEINGFEVLTAIDGLKGLKKAEESRPDVVLLDLRLPDINGFDVLKQIKTKPENANMHVIMITGDRTIDIDKAFAMGADDCIIKPIDMGYLVKRIEKLKKKKYSILVVEDDRQICEMLKNMLVKQGYDTVIFNDGKNLVENIKKINPDMILLDVSLPVGPDGIELCKMVKNDPSTKKLPVLMLTANDNSGAVEKCFSYGAEDYLFKPFNVIDLSLKIRKFLRMSGRNQ